uniref:HAT C-terminal dimerisation domain-containing protein n=1 Tax=Molossus molossus TaxID=27622 RepID=A0A7J8GK99_MOLMO|nr:hypothetical protein HJG59_011448 [Molossus molossus]
MFMRFYELRDEVKQFMEMKGRPVRELNDSKWLCDLAFMVDMAKYLSELNIKLNSTVHFPTLEGQKPSTTLEYADECAKLTEAFNEEFKDVKSKQMKLNTFAAQFNVEPADVTDNLQHEIIQLQSNDELQIDRYNNLPLLEFYKYYISTDEFPILRRHALKYASASKTTYCCKQFFSKFTIANSQLRSRLTDANLEIQFQVSISSIPANITHLTKEKQFQPSH